MQAVDVKRPALKRCKCAFKDSDQNRKAKEIRDSERRVCQTVDSLLLGQMSRTVQGQALHDETIDLLVAVPREELHQDKKLRFVAPSIEVNAA